MLGVEIQASLSEITWQTACIGQRSPDKAFMWKILEYLLNPFQDRFSALRSIRRLECQIVGPLDVSDGGLISATRTDPIECQQTAIKCELRLRLGEILRTTNQRAVIHR